jgi:hypothetical protein
MLVRMWRKGDLLYTVGNNICIGIMANSIKVLKNKNRTTIWPCNLTPGVGGFTATGTEVTVSRRCLFCHVFCYSIYNTQYMKSNKVPTHEWVHKENVAHTHSEILFTHKQRMKFCHLQQHSWNWGHYIK